MFWLLFNQNLIILVRHILLYMCKKSGEKGQVAVEYLMMLSIILLIFAVVWARVNQVASSTEINLRISSAETLLEKLRANIDLVNFYGEPTKIETKIYVPAGVGFINLSYNEIIMGVNTQSGVTIMGIETRANLTGELPLTKGYYVIKIQAVGGNISLSY